MLFVLYDYRFDFKNDCCTFDKDDVQQSLLVFRWVTLQILNFPMPAEAATNVVNII